MGQARKRETAAVRKGRKEAPSAPEAPPKTTLAERGRKINEKLDEILDEIDRVLEHEDTAVNYVQLGGE